MYRCVSQIFLARYSIIIDALKPDGLLQLFGDDC